MFFRRTKSHKKWICENGLNFRLLCIYFCKNISQLPGHLIKHSIQCTLLSFWISRIHSATLTTFSGILTPSYVLPSCNSCCLPFPDKNKGKNIVLNQHSVNGHTKPLSEKQRLSERWGGLICRKLLLESAQH